MTPAQNITRQRACQSCAVASKMDPGCCGASSVLKITESHAFMDWLSASRFLIQYLDQLLFATRRPSTASCEAFIEPRIVICFTQLNSYSFIPSNDITYLKLVFIKGILNDNILWLLISD